MDYTLLIGNTAVVCTVVSNFAGLSVCLDILRRKSTSGVSSLPFLSAAICTFLWLQYGIMVQDGVLTAVNAMAVLMQCSYLTCYYYCCTTTDDKASLSQSLMCATGFLLCVYGYSFHVARPPLAVHTLGLLASGGSIVASAAPLALVKEVFRTRSARNLPFLIVLGSFVVTTLWCIYGVMRGDAFIKVPNFIGALLSGLQLSLFFCFDSKDPQQLKLD